MQDMGGMINEDEMPGSMAGQIGGLEGAMGFPGGPMGGQMDGLGDPMGGPEGAVGYSGGRMGGPMGGSMGGPGTGMGVPGSPMGSVMSGRVGRSGPIGRAMYAPNGLMNGPGDQMGRPEGLVGRPGNPMGKPMSGSGDAGRYPFGPVNGPDDSMGRAPRPSKPGGPGMISDDYAERPGMHVPSLDANGAMGEFTGNLDYGNEDYGHPRGPNFGPPPGQSGPLRNPHQDYMAGSNGPMSGPGGSMGQPGGPMGGPGISMGRPGDYMDGPGGSMGGPGGPMARPRGPIGELGGSVARGPQNYGGPMGGPSGPMGDSIGPIGGSGGPMSGLGGQMGAPGGPMGGPGGPMGGRGDPRGGPGSPVEGPEDYMGGQDGPMGGPQDYGGPMGGGGGPMGGGGGPMGDPGGPMDGSGGQMSGSGGPMGGPGGPMGEPGFPRDGPDTPLEAPPDYRARHDGRMGGNQDYGGPMSGPGGPMDRPGSPMGGPGGLMGGPGGPMGGPGEQMGGPGGPMGRPGASAGGPSGPKFGPEGTIDPNYYAYAQNVQVSNQGRINQNYYAKSYYGPQTQEPQSQYVAYNQGRSGYGPGSFNQQVGVQPFENPGEMGQRGQLVNFGSAVQRAPNTAYIQQPPDPGGPFEQGSKGPLGFNGDPNYIKKVQESLVNITVSTGKPEIFLANTTPGDPGVQNSSSMPTNGGYPIGIPNVLSNNRYPPHGPNISIINGLTSSTRRCLTFGSNVTNKSGYTSKSQNMQAFDGSQNKPYMLGIIANTPVNPSIPQNRSVVSGNTEFPPSGYPNDGIKGRNIKNTDPPNDPKNLSPTISINPPIPEYLVSYNTPTCSKGSTPHDFATQNVGPSVKTPVPGELTQPPTYILKTDADIYTDHKNTTQIIKQVSNTSNITTTTATLTTTSTTSETLKTTITINQTEAATEYKMEQATFMFRKSTTIPIPSVKYDSLGRPMTSLMPRIPNFDEMYTPQPVPTTQDPLKVPIEMYPDPPPKPAPILIDNSTTG